MITPEEQFVQEYTAALQDTPNITTTEVQAMISAIMENPELRPELVRIQKLTDFLRTHLSKMDQPFNWLSGEKLKQSLARTKNPLIINQALQDPQKTLEDMKKKGQLIAKAPEGSTIGYRAVHKILQAGLEISLRTITPQIDFQLRTVEDIVGLSIMIIGPGNNEPEADGQCHSLSTIMSVDIRNPETMEITTFKVEPSPTFIEIPA